MFYPQSEEQYLAIIHGAAKRAAQLAAGTARKASRAGILAGRRRKLAAINDYQNWLAEIEMGA